MYAHVLTHNENLCADVQFAKPGLFSVWTTGGSFKTSASLLEYTNPHSEYQKRLISAGLSPTASAICTLKYRFGSILCFSPDASTLLHDS